MFNYQIYGLALAANVPIPGLLSVPAKKEPDLTVSFGKMPSWFRKEEVSSEPWYVSPDRNERDRPRLIVWKLRNGFLWARYQDDTQFLIDGDVRRVWTTWPPELSLEDTVIYFEGPILGLIMRLKGKVSLHASSVAIGEQAAALVGPAGSGKSTTAAAFAGLGYQVLSEDVVALEETHDGFEVLAGYPRIRLWPESVKILTGRPDGLPLLTPTWDKRFLDLGTKENGFAAKSLTLKRIYFLEDRTADTAAPFIRQINRREALIKLVGNTYANYLLKPDMRAEEFAVLGQLLAKVSVRTVHPSTDPGLLRRLCDLIVQDFRKDS